MKKIKRGVKKIKDWKNKIPKNLVLFAFSLIIIISGIGIIWISSLKIPDFQSFEDRKVANSTKIYDRTGEILLYNVFQDAKRTDVGFDAINQNVKNATIAIEDAEFYNHHGIRITSIIRAFLANTLGTGKTQGGSTITQQLVKNTLLTQKKTLTRKIKEWVLALKIEKTMSKDKILEHYLNEAPYGGNIYGIEEASQTYFNKHAKDLTITESAYLAAIPQSPSVLSPYGKNKQKLEDRKNLVLEKMLSLGYISQEEFDSAKNESVIFSPQTIGGIKAPHFVFFIKEYLEEKYGKDLVENGGLRVTTTLDYTLQEEAEKIVKEGALQNAKDWNGQNAALVAIDPNTGQILSMVGSRDYFDKEIDGNFNVATGLRQPGSSFKPFIYATAFNKGFTPETVLFDLPTQFNSSCGPYDKSDGRCYMPENYDGNYRGPMTLRAALAQSINIPAVKLFYLAGLKDAQKLSEDMGISTLDDIDRYGLTLVIGGGEVKLLDITSAYGVFASGGIRNPYNGILKVEDKNGKILEEFNLNSRRVLPENTALTISDVLSDNTSRAPTFGLNSALNIKNTAVKTGTTNSNRDAWTVGYSTNIVVGVWAGNNDNQAMKKGGVAMAGPIWNKFMNFALSKNPATPFNKPIPISDDMDLKPVLRGSWMGNDAVFIDKISKKLATEKTPRETLEEKVITNVHSILYWVDKNNITGLPPQNPQSDSQFRNWETPVLDWWNKNFYKYKITTQSEIPTEYDDVHKDEYAPVVVIQSPSPAVLYDKNQNIEIKINSAGKFPIQKTEVFINDEYINTVSGYNSFTFKPVDIKNIQNQNQLTLIVYDSVFNKTEATVFFNVQ